MALTKWKPHQVELTDFDSVRKEVDRLFEKFCRRRPGSWERRLEDFGKPFIESRVDIQDTPSEFILRLHVPQVSRDEIEISVTERSVTIKEARKRLLEAKGHTETQLRVLQRVIPLPGPVDPDKATACLRQGELVIVLPKAQEARAKSLRVEVE